MRIHILSSKPRRRPRVGDRRITKKHGLQIRVLLRHDGMIVMGGGHRYNLHEWRRPEELARCDRYLLTDEERAKFFPPEREAGYMQQRGAA